MSGKHAVRPDASFKVCLALVLSGVLSACGSILDSKRPAPEEYVLQTRFAPAAALEGAQGVQVLRVQAEPGYDTQRILTRHSDGRLEPIRDARWVGTVPRMLEMAAVDALRAQGIPAETSSSLSRQPQALQLTVRRFDAVYSESGAAPTVVVAIDAEWLLRSDRLRIRQDTATIEVRAAANRRGAITAAFAEATQGALAKLAIQAGNVTALQQ